MLGNRLSIKWEKVGPYFYLTDINGIPLIVANSTLIYEFLLEQSFQIPTGFFASYNTSDRITLKINLKAIQSEFVNPLNAKELGILMGDDVQDYYKITLINNTPTFGTISAPKWAKTSATILIIPNANYGVSSLLDNSTQQIDYIIDNEYVISSISSNHTIEISFVALCPICASREHSVPTLAPCGTSEHYECDGLNHANAPCGVSGHYSCTGSHNQLHNESCTYRFCTINGTETYVSGSHVMYTHYTCCNATSGTGCTAQNDQHHNCSCCSGCMSTCPCTFCNLCGKCKSHTSPHGTYIHYTCCNTNSGSGCTASDDTHLPRACGHLTCASGDHSICSLCGEYSCRGMHGYFYAGSYECCGDIITGADGGLQGCTYAPRYHPLCRLCNDYMCNGGDHGIYTYYTCCNATAGIGCTAQNDQHHNCSCCGGCWFTCPCTNCNLCGKCKSHTSPHGTYTHYTCCNTNSGSGCTASNKTHSQRACGHLTCASGDHGVCKWCRHYSCTGTHSPGGCVFNL